MARGKTDLVNRPNTLKENELLLRELQSRNKTNHKSLHEINKLIGKFNAKCSLKISKNAKASLGAKQEKITDNPYGPVDGFPPGSWWGIRMDCSRDHVHEPFDEDIKEGPLGAVSLCTSHLSTSNDVDLGDCLTFTAGDHVSSVQFEHPLVKNYQNQVPLRLIRSYNLTNDYAPKTGYRYDGLYAVIACWIGVTSDTEKHYKFALARLHNQELPAWQLSPESGSLGSRVKTFHPHNTRCSVERFANGIPRGDSQNSSNDEETTSSVNSRSSMARSALKKINVSGSVVSSDGKRNSHESDIVTRCISKKPDVSSLVGGMISVPYAESSSSSSPSSSISANNRLLVGNFSKSALCKLQNTNISIRTDLYDSSNGSAHQESRKTTPMTFCRTYKGSRLPARMINHSNVVTLNLNSCGPCPKTSVQESLIQSRSGVVKFSSGQSPSSDRSNDRSTPKSSSATTHFECKTSINDVTTSSSSPVINEPIAKLSVPREIEVTRREIPEKSPIDGEKSMENVSYTGAKIIHDVANKEIQDNDKSHETTLSKRDETRDEEITRETRADLDSLTPDQMVNFIVKQKYHPTAKLLIGSVIGLATGESTILRAYESLITRKNHWTRGNTVRSEENEISSMREKSENLPIVDYERGKNSTNKERCNERNVSKTVTSKRATRESKQDRMVRKMKLGRTRVSKRLLGTDKKSSSTSVRPSTVQRLRRSNITDVKTQQAFSKSTILKKSKKRAKKRRGELANLVIDANIGPIVRGPRNRRLRCGTHIFPKKRHQGNKDAPSCCAEKVTEVARGKRVELSPRKSKDSAGKSRVPESSFANTRKRAQRENEMSYSGKRRVKLLKTDLNGRQQNSTKNQSGKGEKRKLPRTRSCSREDSWKNHDIQRVRMIDATTQCSTSRRDATTCIDREIFDPRRSVNHLDTVKIEWIDVDDVKSVIQESRENELSRHGTNDQVQNFQEDDQASTVDSPTRRREIGEPSTIIGPRLSAFVPVNITDGDSRIVRLRSIGFRPIQSNDEKQLSTIGNDENSWSGCSKDLSKNTAVTSRDVDELFNKYTSEETTAVGYMDQELHYQDIEGEETTAFRKTRNVYGSAKRGRRALRVGNEKIVTGKMDKNEMTRDQIVSLTEEDSEEVPWHGWKKFVKNKQAQWIGW